VLRRAIGIVFGVLLLEACLVAQAPATARESYNPRASAEQHRVRGAVRSFLTVWLVHRDVDKASSSFATAAFRNEAILAAPCSAYIKTGHGGSEAARRAGGQKFLRDFLPAKPATALREILAPETLGAVVEQLGSSAVNDPQADLFALTKLRREQLPVSESADSESADARYLRKYLPASFYVSFVPISDGLVYLVWVPEHNAWRIYHASIV